MKKKLVYLLILLVSIIVQISVLPVISQLGHIGDAVLMAVLVLSILDGFSGFLGWAVVFGIVYDLAAYSSIGEHVLIFLAVVYFVSFFSRRLSVDIKGAGLLFFIAFIVAATIISDAAITLVAAWEMQTFHGYWKIFGGLKSIGIQIVYNGVLFFIWFVLIRKIKNFFGIQ